MAMAYTPGLKRKELYSIRKIRMLPVPGEVLTDEGNGVTPNQVVAKTMVPGKPQTINICLALGSPYPQEVPEYMIKKVGDSVKKGEAIAARKGFWFKERRYASEFDGTVEYISSASGQIIIREPSVPLEVNAYIPGTVVKVLPKEGVVIECVGAFIQGIFGIGGEAHGELMLVAASPADILTADEIRPECSGRVLVGGSLVTGEALRRAVAVGVRGIVVGGIQDKDLSDFLGYEIGVAITGHEEKGLTLIVTEGFGPMNMAEKTFMLLKKHEGKLACITGATQIRAGVIRPEVIIPLDDSDLEGMAEPAEETDLVKEGLRPGIPVRVIRKPYFGALGRIVSLPVELQGVQSESRVRVLEAELEDGRRVIIPRANVEIIEE